MHGGEGSNATCPQEHGLKKAGPGLWSAGLGNLEQVTSHGWAPLFPSQEGQAGGISKPLPTSYNFVFFKSVTSQSTKDGLASLQTIMSHVCVTFTCARLYYGHLVPITSFNPHNTPMR